MRKKPYDPEAWKTRWFPEKYPTPWKQKIRIREPWWTATRIATMASLAAAAAALGSVYTGYLQYDATLKAVSAADRNRVFQGLMTSIDAMCLPARQRPLRVAADFDRLHVVVIDESTIPSASVVASDPIALTQDIEGYRAATRLFEIWNDSGPQVSEMAHQWSARLVRETSLKDPRKWAIAQARLVRDCSERQTGLALMFKHDFTLKFVATRYEIVSPADFSQVVKNQNRPSASGYSEAGEHYRGVTID